MIKRALKIFTLLSSLFVLSVALSNEALSYNFFSKKHRNSENEVVFSRDGSGGFSKHSVCKRPNWTSCYAKYHNYCVNTRHEIIAERCKVLSVQKSGSFHISVSGAECRDYYTGEEINDVKKVQIDHVLPWYWIQRHGGCDRAKAIYNDPDNLVIASEAVNDKKANVLQPEWMSDEKLREIRHRQYNFCNKWGLSDCDELLFDSDSTFGIEDNEITQGLREIINEDDRDHDEIIEEKAEIQNIKNSAITLGRKPINKNVDIWNLQIPNLDEEQE